MDTISIIVPCFNEVETLPHLIERLKGQKKALIELGFGSEIIVVNDGSQDNTKNILSEIEGVTALHHLYNLGNGAAIKTGIRTATGKYVLFIDADLQHPPERIPELVRVLTEGFDMVVGSRTRQCKTIFVRNLGNTILRKIASFLVDHPIADLTSGFRVVRRDLLLRLIKLIPNRYSYSTTITMALIKQGYFVRFMPFDDITRRIQGSSHIRPLRDGFRFISIMLRIIMLFNPNKVFGLVSLFLFVLGTCIVSYQIATREAILGSSIVVLLSALFSFLFGLLADQVSHIRREM